MTMTESTRSELVKHRDSREASLAELYRQAGGDDQEEGDLAEAVAEQEAALEELYDYALGVDIRHTLRIQISTGGPAEWLEVPVVREQYGWAMAGAVEFHYADWGAHDQVTVDEDSALYRYAEEMVELMGEGEA